MIKDGASHAPAQSPAPPAKKEEDPAPDAAPPAISISRRKIDYGVGGYDPKNRPGAAMAIPAPAVASDPVGESAPAEASPMPLSDSVVESLSAAASIAPEGRKIDYGAGYDPKNRPGAAKAPAVASDPVGESAPAEAAPLPASSPAAAAAAATSARPKIDYGVGGYNPAKRSVERAPSSAAVPPSTSEANERNQSSLSSMPSISSKSAGPGDGDVKTQTNTGRFHKLVDFDHTGMDDKEFREALKEKMQSLREESPGNRCAGANSSTDIFFVLFFFVELLRRYFRTFFSCLCYQSSLNLHV